MPKAKRLKPGDTIAFATPASPLTADKLENATRLFEQQGYRVKVMPHALDVDDYLAGSDADRAKDLQSAFDDPEISAVFCNRGGYGCARLFPYLDLDQIARAGKLLIGFSDITTLHAALNRRGVPSLHAPMSLTLAYDREPWVQESLLHAMKGENPLFAKAPSATSVVGGVAEGRLVGGCLCLICDSVATPEEVPFQDNLLLIEDVDEAPHRIDAMLTHLLNSGRAQRASGFVIGEMTRTDERVDQSIGGKSWRTIVKDRLAPLGKPTILDFPFGHAKQMLTLPLGVMTRLDADSGALSFLETWCE